MHMHQPPATQTSPRCPTTAISMPTIASAPNQLPDPVDEEIAALQKRNQLFELQQRRSQLMAQANLEQGTWEQQVSRDVTLVEYQTLYSANWTNQHLILLRLSNTFRPS